MGITEELINFLQYMGTIMQIRYTSQSTRTAVKHTLDNASYLSGFFGGRQEPEIRIALSYLTQNEPYDVMSTLLTFENEHLWDNDPVKYDEAWVRSQVITVVLLMMRFPDSSSMPEDCGNKLPAMVKLAVKHEGTGQDGDVQKRLAKATEIMQLVHNRCVHYKYPPFIEAFVRSFLVRIS